MQSKTKKLNKKRKWKIFPLFWKKANSLFFLLFHHITLTFRQKRAELTLAPCWNPFPTIHCCSVCSGMCSVTMARTHRCDIICHCDVRAFVGTVSGLFHWSVSSRCRSGWLVCPRWWTQTQRGSDGGLGEGDSEVLVVIQLVVMQSDQSLDGLLYWHQLHQSHLPVFPVTSEEVTSSPHMSTGRRKYEVLRSFKLCWRLGYNSLGIIILR